MAVMQCGKYHDVFKFHSTGIEQLMREALDYMAERRARGAKIGTVEFVDEEDCYKIRLWWDAGTDAYGNPNEG